MAGLRIRDASPTDIGRLHTINAASTPGVGAVTIGELARLQEMASLTVVAELAGGRLLGFILCMFEGTDYRSPNYRWCVDHYPQFAYCDRIAVASEARGQGVGEKLYAEACRRLAGSRRVLLCEVNLEPPNPGSMRFHERLGFRYVGERWLPDRSYGVAYLEKQLCRQTWPCGT